MAQRAALVVGGTAATGRIIVRLLQDRGYKVTLYNRGRHNDGLDGPPVEFLIGDPHFRDTIAADLGKREWDVTIATYGRTRYLAEALQGRTGHFVAVSGMPVVRADRGMPTSETDPPIDPSRYPVAMRALIPRIIDTENAVLTLGRNGAFGATIVRYPNVYGPHSLVPAEFHVMRRVRDRRKRWALIDGGLIFPGYCASANAAALIAAVIDRPAEAASQIFHAADDRQLTLREWIETVARALDHRFEFVSVPASLARLGQSCVPMAGGVPFMHSADDIAAGRLRHRLPQPARAREKLGYVQAVDPVDWLRRTVEYWLAHPDRLESRARETLSALDFDYAAEDALLSWWDAVAASAPAFGRPVTRDHPYDHPREGS